MKLIKSLLAAVSACAIGLNSIAALPCTEAAAMELEGVTENTALYKSCGKLTAGTVELTLDELKAANYTVTVPITVSGTSGWRDLGFGVSYSTADLTCTKVSNGSAIVHSGYTVYPGVGINKDKGLVWCGYSVAQNSSMYDFVSDGEAAVLTFTVASDAAPGDSYQIKLLAENNGTQQEIVTAYGTDSCFLEDGAIIIKGSATTTSRATTTTTRATTTMTTTEPKLTTTTTTTTDSIPAEFVLESIEVVAGKGYYFSHDENAFDLATLVSELTLVGTLDGEAYTVAVSADSIANYLTLEYATPAEYYTAEAEAYVANILGLTFKPSETMTVAENADLTVTDEPMVYIGVKGDADLNGKVQVSDATNVLTYYAFSVAGLSASFTYFPAYDDEVFVYFLADVDTESTAGKDSDAGKIQVADASNILTYYAQDGAGMDPRWQDIIPSLVDIPNSLWAYKAGR